MREGRSSPRGGRRSPRSGDDGDENILDSPRREGRKAIDEEQLDYSNIGGMDRLLVGGSSLNRWHMVAGPDRGGRGRDLDVSGMGWSDVDPMVDATALSQGITGRFLGSTSGLNSSATLERGGAVERTAPVVTPARRATMDNRAVQAEAPVLSRRASFDDTLRARELEQNQALLSASTGVGAAAGAAGVAGADACRACAKKPCTSLLSALTAPCRLCAKCVCPGLAGGGEEKDEDTANQADWLLAESEGLYKAPLRASVKAIVDKGRLRNRVMRETASLIQKASDEIDILRQAGDDEEKDGERVLSARELRTTLDKIRSRGVATVDDYMSLDGRLKTCGDPVVPSAQRSVEMSLLREAAKLKKDGATMVRVPATGVGHDLAGRGLRHAELIIALSKVAIYDHPLFTPEERLASLLRAAYGTYRTHLDGDLSTYHARRLEALVERLEAFHEASMVEGDEGEAESRMAELRNAAYRDATTRHRRSQPPGAEGSAMPKRSVSSMVRDTHDDALQTLSALVDDEHTTRTLGRDLYDTWRAVQQARLEAGGGEGSKPIRSTPLNLKTVKVDVPDLPKKKKKRKSGIGAGAMIGAECRVLETLKRFEKMLGWVKETIIEGREQEARDKRRARAAHFRNGEEDAEGADTAPPGSPQRAKRDEDDDREEPDSPRTTKFHKKQAAEDAEWIDTTYKLIEASRTLILTDQGGQPGKKKKRSRGGDGKEDDDGMPPDPSSLFKPNQPQVGPASSGYVLKLTTGDTSITPDDELDNAGRIRRHKLRRLQVYAVTKVNGEQVSRTSSATMDWPSMVATLDRIVRLRLVHRPRSVEVEIWARGGGYLGLTDIKIATIPVPLPGQGGDLTNAPITSITQTASWYQFADAKTMPAMPVVQRGTEGGLCAGLLSCVRSCCGSGGAGEGGDEAELMRRTHGSMLIGAQWSPDPSHHKKGNDGADGHDGGMHDSTHSPLQSGGGGGDDGDNDAGPPLLPDKAVEMDYDSLLIGREGKENSMANRFTKESDFLNLIPNSNKVKCKNWLVKILLSRKRGLDRPRRRTAHNFLTTFRTVGRPSSQPSLTHVSALPPLLGGPERLPKRAASPPARGTRRARRQRRPR